MPSNESNEILVGWNTGTHREGIAHRDDIDTARLPHALGIMKAMFVTLINRVVTTFIAENGGFAGDPSKRQDLGTVHPNRRL
jgi:hypothetical protein